MNIENLNQLLHQIQKNEALHQEKILGVSLWSIVKSPLYEVLLRKLGNNEIENEVDKILKKNTILYSFKRLLKAKTILLFRKNSFYQKFDGIMFVNVMASHVQNGKTTFNFSDLIISEQYNHQFLLIHNDKGHQFTNEFKHPPHFPSNPFKFPPTLFLSKKQKNRYLQQLQNLSSIIHDTLKKDNFDEKITQHVIDNLFHNKVIKAIANFEKEYHRFKKFLQHYKPKFIYLTNSQSHQGIILNAKENNIPVIELQHGLYTRYHRVFDWPQFYRNQLNVMPDYFFVWGDFWKELTLMNHSYWTEENVISVGNPNFDLFRGSLTDNNPTNHNIEGMNILITSNYIVAEELAIFFEKFFSKYASEINERKWHFYLKLHPVENLHPIFQNLLSLHPNFFTFIEKKHNFKDAINDKHLLVSTFSTTILEALGLNKHAIVVDLLGSAEVLNSFPNLSLHISKNPEELFDAITNSKEINTELQAERIFKPNAIKHINENISQICKR